MIRSSAAPDDERALIERARTDPDAFAELYRRHVDGIHRFARRRTGDGSEAEDITAVTFERALAGLARFRPGPDGIAPWLYRIAGNEILDTTEVAFPEQDMEFVSNRIVASLIYRF